MCYFSDAERRKELHGAFTYEQIEQLANALFHRALKLQIGCGAEPTLYRELPELIRLGRAKGVPFISLTTNGQLLDEQRLDVLADAGLDELTLSLHGATVSTYERMMQGASFGRFISLLKALSVIKQHHPHFRVRINYTINVDNMRESLQLPQLLRGVPVNVVQLRPIQRIGNTAYQNFSVEPMLTDYDRIFPPLVKALQGQGIVCIYPTKENLKSLLGAVDSKRELTPHQYRELMWQNFIYCNITPVVQWYNDFNAATDTFETYCRNHNRGGYFVSSI